MDDQRLGLDPFVTRPREGRPAAGYCRGDVGTMDNRVGRSGVAEIKIIKGIGFIGLDPGFVVRFRRGPFGFTVRNAGGANIGYPAAWTRAAFRAGGNSFPLLSALLNIPAQAFWLKKYRRGRSPISKISDKYASAASLRDSEVFSVNRSIGDIIPEFNQRPDKGGEIGASGLSC